MNIKILGAARNVTGSKFLVEANNKRILVDCGLYQERDLKSRNWEKFPVEPESIDYLLLTHAHLDHCGYIPRLVKSGFKGEIFCTEPTAEIAKIVLLDSAKLQEEDVEKKKQRHQKEERESPYPEVPLYTVNDAQNTLHLFRTFKYKDEFEIFDGITVSFYNAGHILGSSMIKLNIKEKGKVKKLIFSGDIGRWNKPVLDDPTVFESADIVFIESTYGDRLHESEGESGEKFKEVINKTVEQGGNTVIPTFAIERAQELLYFLDKFLDEGQIPHILVFVDSPMAINVTEVFKKYPEYLDDRMQKIIKEGNSPFNFPLLKLTRTTAESKAINYIKGSSIIMAGSGMCTGGRIKHHLITNISRRESTILFVGYQARGTLGREIIEKNGKNDENTVRIHGKHYPIKASIEKINGFSAHADRNELLKWITSFKKHPKKIFIVHGEEESAISFSSLLKEKMESEITVPFYLDEFSL